VDLTGKQCLTSYPFLSGPSFREAEVALGYPQIHTLGFAKRIASRLKGKLNFSFNGASRAQITPLESVKNVSLFCAHVLAPPP